MKPDIMADLRAASLAATLHAARGRRICRRVWRGAGAAAVAALLALQTFHSPQPALVQSAQPEMQAIPQPVETIRTHIGSTPRVSTATAATSHFSTESAVPVERISTADLARCFPGQGIALIACEGGPPRLVLIQ